MQNFDNILQEKIERQVSERVGILGDVGKEFFKEYFKKVEELQDMSLHNDSRDDRVQRFVDWFNKKGYLLILNIGNCETSSQS